MAKIYERLNIPEERGKVLGRKCEELYEAACKNRNKEDAIDVIEKARAFTKNASEDIFVCFIIGVMQGGNLTSMNAVQVSRIISEFFK